MGFDMRKSYGNAVVGIFDGRSAIERAVDQLKLRGFSNSDLSILMQDRQETLDFAEENETKAPEGAATGASTGILGGGILGWLAGAGALAIPGVGPFVAAGPIMGAIAGAGLGGTLGGIAGGLIGMGIPDHEAHQYEMIVKEGGILLCVHVDSYEESAKAQELLQECGARNVARVSEPLSGQDIYNREAYEQEFGRSRSTGVDADPYSNEL